MRAPSAQNSLGKKYKFSARGVRVTLSLVLLVLLRSSAVLWGTTLYRCPRFYLPKFWKETGLYQIDSEIGLFTFKQSYNQLKKFN